MSEYPVRLGNGQDTATRMRAADAAVRMGTTGVRARAGLRPDGGGVVTAVAGTMGVQVTAFSCWVDAGSVGQVGFPFVLDATTTLTLDPGDATLARVDTIAVVADASTPTTATLQVVKGTPGAGAPTLPTHAVPLRDVNVPAGLSSGTGGLSSGNISTDRRVYSVAAGGVLPVASQAERDALGAKTGQAVYRLDTDVIEVKTAAGWSTWTPDGTDWTSYTPAFTASAGTPSVVNGSLVGKYQVRGDTVHFVIRYTVGSSDALGTGQWRFSLPAGQTPESGRWPFTADLFDTSAGQNVTGTAVWTGSYLEVWAPGTTAGGYNRAVSNIVPVSWAAGDVLTIRGTYKKP